MMQISHTSTHQTLCSSKRARPFLGQAAARPSGFPASETSFLPLAPCIVRNAVLSSPKDHSACDPGHPLAIRQPMHCCAFSGRSKSPSSVSILNSSQRSLPVCSRRARKVATAASSTAGAPSSARGLRFSGQGFKEDLETINPQPAFRYSFIQLVINGMMTGGVGHSPPK